MVVAYDDTLHATKTLNAFKDIATGNIVIPDLATTIVRNALFIPGVYPLSSFP